MVAIAMLRVRSKLLRPMLVLIHTGTVQSACQVLRRTCEACTDITDRSAASEPQASWVSNQAASLLARHYHLCAPAPG